MIFFFKYLDMVNKILINRKQSEFQHLSGQTDISIHIITGGICLIFHASTLCFIPTQTRIPTLIILVVVRLLTGCQTVEISCSSL